MTAIERAAWLEERRSGLGATDISSIVGTGFSSPLEVWRDKVEPSPDRKPHPLLLIGLATEDVNAALYSEKMDVDLVRHPTLTRHPTLPFVFSTLDRSRSDRRPVELKYTPFFNGEAWGDELTDAFPNGYLVQTQTQMACMGAGQADVSVLSGTGEHRIYRSEANPAFIELLMNIAADFWHNFVETKTPPPPNWMDARAEAVTGICQRIAAGKSVVLDAAATLLASEYKGLKRIEKDAKFEAEQRYEQLKKIMGDAEKAVAGPYTIKRIKVDGGKAVSYVTSGYVKLDIREPKRKGVENERDRTATVEE